jgi:ubiquinone/menaquinone biosynthesis C-methylase UbiE
MNQDYGNLQKHLNPNPIQRYLLRRFHRQVAFLLKATGAKRVLDAGCGEGFAVNYLLREDDELVITGIDCSLEAIEMARQMVPPVLSPSTSLRINSVEGPVLSPSTLLRINSAEGPVLSKACPEPFDPSVELRTGPAQDKPGRRAEGSAFFEVGDLREMPYSDDSFDLVMCLEVLEHLLDPHKGLRELRRVTSAHCLLSVPHEPFFRAINFLRGKHVSAWGRDPEHLQHWTARQFRRLVEQYFEVERFVYSFPWVIALGHKL